LKTTWRRPVKAETCSCLVQSLNILTNIVVFDYILFPRFNTALLSVIETFSANILHFKDKNVAGN